MKRLTLYMKTGIYIRWLPCVIHTKSLLRNADSSVIATSDRTVPWTFNRNLFHAGSGGM